MEFEDESLWGDWEWGDSIWGGDAATSVYTAPTGAGLTMTNAALVAVTLSNSLLEE